MQPLRIPIRVVFYQAEGVWVAHCLEFNLLGDGDSRAEALQMLSDAIQLQVAATREYGNPANLFSPADGEYFRMFAAGEDVAAPGLTLHFEPTDDIRIEVAELREFTRLQPAVA